MASREQILQEVRKHGMALRRAPADFRRDREVVLVAVSQSGLALLYASEALRGDLEVVRAAVQQTGEAFGFASKELRNDPEVVLAMARLDHTHMDTCIRLRFTVPRVSMQKALFFEPLARDSWRMYMTCVRCTTHEAARLIAS